MPVAALVDDCPLYDLEPAEPDGWIYGNRADARGRGQRRRPCSSCLASPSIASKRWAFEQYDSIVALAHGAPARGSRRRGPASARGRGDDRGLDRRQRPPGRLRSLRGHGRGGARVRPEPRLRRAPSRSGSPTASTSATRRSRRSPGSSTARPRALADACEALGVPVVGGNVSLYNETDAGPDLPDAGRRHGRRARPIPSAPAASRSRDGDAIAVCGPVLALARRLGAGEAARRARARASRRCRSPRSRPRSRRSARRSRPARSAAAHDVSDGGLACALAEMAIAGGVGARGRPRRAGRGARLLGRDGAVRRGPGRLRGRRRPRPSSSGSPTAGSTCS